MFYICHDIPCPSVGRTLSLTLAIVLLRRGVSGVARMSSWRKLHYKVPYNLHCTPHAMPLCTCYQVKKKRNYYCGTRGEVKTPSFATTLAVQQRRLRTVP